MVKAGSDYAWLAVAIESINKMILGIRLSIEKSMLLAEQFVKDFSQFFNHHKDMQPFIHNKNADIKREQEEKKNVVKKPSEFNQTPRRR